MKAKTLLRTTWRNVRPYLAAFCRWLVLGLAVGVSGGALGAVFSHAVAFVTSFRGEHGWLVLLLPVGGVLIAALYRLCRVTGIGTNEVLEAVRSEKQVPILLAPAIFLGTVVTHLFGGSAGREGAALQLGGSVASVFGKIMKLDREDRNVLTMCGMAAVFSAVFGTPMAAVIFAVEVASVGKLVTSALFPAAVSSISAFCVAEILRAEAERFPVSAVPAVQTDVLLRVLLVAVAAGIVSMLFCWAMHAAAHLFQKYFKNDFLRAAAGGLLLIALTYGLQTRDYNGGGFDVIGRIFSDGTVRPEAFLLKILFTAVTIGAGFKGGEIVPTLFIGATLGGTLSFAVGLAPGFGAAVGMTALFCGVTNCPIASVLLAIELFGADGAIFYMLAAFVSFLLSGYFSLYSGQKIVFSKLKADEIDISAHG